MARTVSRGSIYKHYKGKFYQVHSIAKHTETHQLMVNYHLLHFETIPRTYNSDVLWARPLDMFLEDVIVDGKNVQRFTNINDIPVSSYPPNNTLCSVCKKPQYITLNGICCDNGHGGAPSLSEERDK